MVSAYRYAMFKSVRLKSTWVIVLIGCGLVLGIAGILPFALELRIVPADRRVAYGTIISYSAGIGTIMVLMVAVFAGSRGATVFRDEVEDGSLLVMLSKPISRSALLFSKWLAYITVLAAFSFLLAMWHSIGVAIGSKGQVASNLIVTGLFTEWGIGIIFGLIFAGIALILSTFLSATQTALAVLVVGVLTSVTSIIQPITSDPQIALSSPSRRVTDFYSYTVQTDTKETNPANPATTTTESASEFQKRLTKDIVKTLSNGGTTALLPLACMIDSTPEALCEESDLKLKDAAGVSLPIQPFKIFPLDIAGLIRNPKAFESLLTSESDFSYSVASFFSSRTYHDTGVKNPYLNLRVIDLNGQANSLTSYVLDGFYSGDTISAIASLNNGRLGQGALQPVKGTELTKVNVAQFYNAVSAVSPPVATSSQTVTQINDSNLAYISAFFNSLPTGERVYAATFKPYISRQDVLIAYILIGVLLTPISLVVLRRKDFR